MNILPVEDVPCLRSGRQAYGCELRLVLRKPLVVPVLMPRLSLDVNDLMNDLQIESRTQIPFSPELWRKVRSRLRIEVVGESQEWDLCFWYIDGAAKWEGADRFRDEVAELMWSLHKWFKLVSQTQTPEAPFRRSDWHTFCGVLEVARRYRRRFILPEVPLDHPTSTARLSEGLPTLRESLLFRPWVKRSPSDSTRNL